MFKVDVKHGTSNNLFDGKIVNGTFSSTEGTLTTAGNRVRMDGNNFIYLQPGTYTINANGVDDVVYYAYTDADITTFFKSDSYDSWLGLPCTFTVNTARYFLFGFRFSDNTAVSVSDISNIMLNSGSEALPYEPYREYKEVEQVYSGSTEISEILDKNGNVLYSANREIEGVPPLTFKGKGANLKNYRIYGNVSNTEQITSNNLFYKVLEGYGFQSDGTIISDASYNMYFAKINPNQDYIGSKEETNSTALTYTLWNVYDHDPTTGDAGLLSSWKTTAGTGIINYTGTDPVYLGLRVPTSVAYPHLNLGTTPLDYDEYQSSSSSVGDKTANLFDGVIEQGTWDAQTIIKNDTLTRCRSNKEITLKAEMAYFINLIDYQPTYPQFLLQYRNANGDNIGESGWRNANGDSVITPSNVISATLIFRIADQQNCVPDDFGKCQIVEGSTALPYEPYGYRVPVTVTNGTSTETTNIYLPEQIKMVGDEAEYIDYGEQKQHRVRKNLLQNTATSQTMNGVTFTVNDDGSVTCNGTNTSASSPIVFHISIHLLIGEYIVNGCPDNGSLVTYSVDLRSASDSSVIGARDTGLGFTFTNSTDRSVYYTIRIAAGSTCDNLTFYPMIRKAEIADDTYEPCIEYTELDVTLPALPTLSGTNTLSVGTETQPSNVYLKGRIKEVS